MARTGVETTVRVLRAGVRAIGPGKADLLACIDQHGSISAAARAMGMSYRRAWLLVDEMNQCFREPLVETLLGGTGGGGARLTDTGRQVLSDYSNLRLAVEAAAAAASGRILASLR